MTRALYATAALVVVIAGMRAASGLLGPIVLALILVVTLSPVRSYLTRWIPGWLATTVLILLLYGILAAGVGSLVAAGIQLASIAPRYADRASDIVDDVQRWLQDLGVESESAQQLVTRLDPSTLANIAQTAAGAVLSLLTNTVFLITLLLFMAVETGGYPARMARADLVRPSLTRALRQFVQGTRRYLVVSTVFGLIVAVFDGIALWILGIPLATLWAVLAFVTNYIPNIGFVIGLAPPAVLALFEGGLGLMIVVIVVYSVINFVLQSIVQPKIVGDSVNLSVTVTFLSLIFWTFILGGVGAVLAVPLTLLARALLVDASPGTRWADLFLAGGGSIRAEARWRPDRKPERQRRWMPHRRRRRQSPWNE
ncbi:AI-2E family transporter [Asanoa sp. WMMD1127]|uniref:AI-2E family transporter n=1 Tax=Asanoa sp. WMMD1127 TaxID=3016107 RepID=UPI002417CC29|nr:AI-2E family transporter [Asanoa sp. WMMD1127]MDG4824874.1 AI-2E family transporter [Asanoa sp. WMMD1127]